MQETSDQALPERRESERAGQRVCQFRSSRRLERECQRNVGLMWLASRLAPGFKTIADFRKDNGKGIRNVCRRFVAICRQLKLFSEVMVAIDGSKFKAVNNRDKNHTRHKLEQRMKQTDESVERYMAALETADRTQPVEAEAKTLRLKDKNGYLLHLSKIAGSTISDQPWVRFQSAPTACPLPPLRLAPTSTMTSARCQTKLID